MFKKILIAVDVADEVDTDRLLDAAKALTGGWTCELHVVNVVPNMGMPIVDSFFDGDFEDSSHKAATDLLSAKLAASGISATQHVQHGKVYDSIISLAGAIKADLILVGAHQPELRDYLLGSNAARVVRHSGSSVLVLRS